MSRSGSLGRTSWTLRLYLLDNQLSGEISCNLEKKSLNLERLDLKTNGLESHIPPYLCWGDNVTLKILIVSNNKLTSKVLETWKLHKLGCSAIWWQLFRKSCPNKLVGEDPMWWGWWWMGTIQVEVLMQTLARQSFFPSYICRIIVFQILFLQRLVLPP